MNRNDTAADYHRKMTTYAMHQYNKMMREVLDSKRYQLITIADTN